MDDEPFRVTFGARVKEAREAAGLTQTQLANRLGRTRSSVANIEAGRQIPSVEVAARCSQALGCDPGWLLSGRMYPYPVRPLVRPADLREIVESAELLAQRTREVERRANPLPPSSSVDEGNPDR